MATITIESLEDKLVKLNEQAKGIIAQADAENRPLLETEQTELNNIKMTFGAVEQDIANRRELEEQENRLTRPAARVVQPEEPVQQSRQAPAQEPSSRLPDRHDVRIIDATRGTWGWRSFGEFANGVRMAARGRIDPRLIANAPATFGSEAQNADGGYALPPDFRADIMTLISSEDSFLSLTDTQTTSSNQLTVPIDATTPWGNTGVNANWIDEGVDITLSKPALGQLSVKAYKLAALVPMTEELLEDVGSMSNYLRTKVPQKFVSAINAALIAGNGTGKPQGLLSSASKVVQAAESGQGAGTVVALNIVKMWGRLYAPLRPGAVWLINQDVEQKLQMLAMPGTAPQVPLYLPPGGFSDSPYGRIFGRPVMSFEACKQVGTEGDIILCNPKSYLTVLKASGMRQDVSIHVYFSSDHIAFRFILRVGGQSWWSAAADRLNGSNTLSNIVTLNSTRT